MNREEELFKSFPQSISFEENLKYFDFKFITFFIKKYLKYVILVTVFSSCYGFYKFKTTDKIWQGEFQIVVSNKNQGTKLGGEGFNLNLFDNSNKDLKTQMVILKTPSVLLPAFEKVKVFRNNEGIDSVNWKFQDFKNNLNIDVIDGTNILGIKYKSKYKEIIPFALENIISVYQQYSFRDKSDKLTNTKTYLKNQINSYKKDMLNKFENIEKLNQEYGFDYTLVGKKVILNTQSKRNKIRDELRAIEQKIINLKKIYNNDEEFIYSSKNLFQSKFLSDIKQIDERIIINKGIFKENDLSFKTLNSRRKIFIEKLKEDTFGHLNAQKLLKESELEAISRPANVETEYKNNVADYLLTDQILTDLALQQKSILLEASKEKDAWEVITKPKVLNQAVYPNLMKMITSNGVIGFFSALVIFYIFEKRKDIILNYLEIESKLGVPVLLDLTTSKIDSWGELLELTAEGIFKFEKEKNISFLLVGELNFEIKEKFISQFKKIFKNNRLVITKSPIEANKGDIQLILASYGELKYSDLDELITKLNLKANSITGIILISKNT